MSNANTSNRVAVSKSVLSGGAAIAAIVTAHNTAQNVEASTIASKQAAILAAAGFVAKHWKNSDVWFMTGNGTKPEQRFAFMVRSLALPEDAFEYGGAGSDMLSRLNTIGSNPAITKEILKAGKATAIGSLAKRVASQVAAAKRAEKIETNKPLETATNPDGSSDAGLPSNSPTKGAKPEAPEVQAGRSLETFLAICKKHSLDASALMSSAILALGSEVEPDAEATSAGKSRKSA